MLRPILAADKRPEEEDAFRASFRPRGEKMDYIDQFPLELDGQLWSVHFSGIMALGSPKVALPWLRAHKEHQLTEEFRQYLRNKLALFFGRPEEN